jgi:16S rRNA (uracil1498-N3)-methyltransferase
MEYFYVPPERIVNGKVEIADEEFTHLVHVMRRKEGDEICIVDGKGGAYDVRLVSVGRRSAEGSVVRMLERSNEPKVVVTCAVGILKNPSRFDFLVEKTTELGVSSIIPLRTARTIPAHAKIERWQKLALAAMKQSGRSRLPEVQELTQFDVVCSSASRYDRCYIAHEQPLGESAAAPLLSASDRNIAILIGPEGGFSDEEVGRAIETGWKPLFLGERRLRTETAAMIAVERFVSNIISI